MSESGDKGRGLELYLAAQLRRKGLDPKAQRMPRSGAIEHLKGDVRTVLRYSFECKASERVSLWADWSQAQGQARMGLAPVLVIGGENRPPLAVVDLNTLLDLLAIERDYLADVPERPALGQKAWKR